MDPDENLKTQLRLAKSILASADAEEDPGLGHPRELAEHVEALHGWIMSGGFLPAAWAPKQPAWSSWEVVVALLCGQVMGIAATLETLETNVGNVNIVVVSRHKMMVRALSDGLLAFARARWAYEGDPPLAVTQSGHDAVLSTSEGKTLRVPLEVFVARDGRVAEQIKPIATFLSDLLGPLK